MSELFKIFDMLVLIFMLIFVISLVSIAFYGVLEIYNRIRQHKINQRYDESIKIFEGVPEVVEKEVSEWLVDGKDEIITERRDFYCEGRVCIIFFFNELSCTTSKLITEEDSNEQNKKQD